jgi:hypothetical protein
MKVYLLMHQECYESAVVIGAFASAETAKQRQAEKLKEHRTLHMYKAPDGKTSYYPRATHFTKAVHIRNYDESELFIDEIEVEE